jgi:hypothetical protein
MNKIAGLAIDVGDELTKCSTIYKNVNQDIIITTEDKIKLVLMNTREVLTAKREWWTPLGLLLTFIATLVTTEFKATMGLSKDTWLAIFIILTFLCVLWLIRALYKLYKNRKQDNLEAIIKKIKLEDASAPERERIVVHQKRFILGIPFSGSWNLNHWGNKFATLDNGKMVFSSDGKQEKEDGSHIDIKGILEIGKSYEVCCFAKSLPDNEGLLQIWLHDNAGSQHYGVDVKTDFIRPKTEGEEIKLLFQPKYNKDVRIHLQYTPRKGQLEIESVNIIELISHD